MAVLKYKSSDGTWKTIATKGGNGVTDETDPVFSASPAASITEEKKAEWDNKVDKVSGKQLSTEDFTSTLKTKLEGLSNYDDTELSNAISTLRGDFDALVSGDTTTAIKTFNEVIAFLDGVQDTQDLSGIIASIEQQLLWTKAEGEAGVRLKGTNGTATGNMAISAGDDKTASDGTPFASVASGDHAVAFGYGNTCAGRTTLAQGLYNIINGKDAVAFGQRNTVNGDQAFAAGQQNEVTARIGVAIGYKNKATNTNSVAIGYQNTSSGSASVAMGDTCEASGTSATAMGYKTKATGASSSTFGQNTQATNAGEVAMGSYNKSTTSTDASEQTAFSFGIGTSDTDRANAFEIKKNGDVYIGEKKLAGDNIFITDFKVVDFIRLKGGEIEELQIDSEALSEAIIAKKTILVPYDEDYVGGYGLLLGETADTEIYLSIYTHLGQLVYTEAYNGIVYAPITIIRDLQVETVQQISLDTISNIAVTNALQTTGGLTYALPYEDTGDEDDTLISRTTLKTINGEAIYGSGDITIGGGGTAVDNVYITEFTVNELDALIADPTLSMQADIPRMYDAMSAHKVVLVPYDNNEGFQGYGVATGYKEDLFYVTITLDNGRYIDLEVNHDSDVILGWQVEQRVWDGKQDKLVSGTNIKTINNQSIVGSGNIEIESGEANVQSDWLETNIVLDSYVKNKTHYVAGTKITSAGSYFIGASTPIYYREKVYNLEIGVRTQIDHTAEGVYVALNNAGILTVEDAANLLGSFPIIAVTEIVPLDDMFIPETIVRTSELKTINGESILGSGNIEISGGEGGGTSSDGRKEVIYFTGTSISNMRPNVIYWAEGFEDFTIESFEEPVYGVDTYDVFTVVLSLGQQVDQTVTLTLPDNVNWANGVIPEIIVGGYELSISRISDGDYTQYFAVLTPFKPVE